MVEALAACEPDMLQVSNISHTLETDQRVLGQLSDLYDRELVGIIGKNAVRLYIVHLRHSPSFPLFNRYLFDYSQTGAGWAKQIPGFSSLALNDQIRLLQSTWAEILTFTLAWRSTPNNGRLRFAQDFTLDERLAHESHCMDLYTHVSNFLLSFALRECFLILIIGDLLFIFTLLRGFAFLKYVLIYLTIYILIWYKLLEYTMQCEDRCRRCRNRLSSLWQMPIARAFSPDRVFLSLFFKQCIQIVERIQRLGLTREEYYMLKALILANSDARSDDPQALYRFRDSILTSLTDCVAAVRHGQAIRVTQNMFLVLPSLRQADGIVRRFWSSVYRTGKVPMNKLFVEMLEAVCYWWDTSCVSLRCRKRTQ